VTYGGRARATPLASSPGHLPATQPTLRGMPLFCLLPDPERHGLLSSPDPLVPLGAREKPAASKLGDVSALAARIDYGRKKSGLDTASHAGATRSPDDRQTLKWTIKYIPGPCTVYVRTCPRIPIDAVVVSWPQNVFCDLVYATIIRRHASRRITITSHGFGSVGAISSVQSSKQPSPCIMLQ